MARHLGSLRGAVRAVRYVLLAGLVAGIGGATAVGCGDNKVPVSATSEGGVEAPAPGSSGVSVLLEHGAHPLARAEFDVGPLDPARRIENLSLVFKLSPPQLRDREALLADLLDPASPSYHQWLTPDAVRGALRREARRTSRARRRGSRAGPRGARRCRRLGARVTFSGTVASLETAFRAEMRRYRGGRSRCTTRWPRRRRCRRSSPTSCSTSTTRTTSSRQPTSGRARDHPARDGTHRLRAARLGERVRRQPRRTRPAIGGKATHRKRRDDRRSSASREIAQSDIDAWRIDVRPARIDGDDDAGAEHRRARSRANGAGIEAVLDIEWSGGIAPGGERQLRLHRRERPERRRRGVLRHRAEPRADAQRELAAPARTARRQRASRRRPDAWTSTARRRTCSGITYLAACGRRGRRPPASTTASRGST